ncbi:MAG TPA: hypothetical protein VF698_15360 [Thermoanaerobaculia bacterium]|jgi:hypothetical protein
MRIVLIVATSIIAASLSAQSATVFRGRPSVKISEGGFERRPETLGREKSVNLECVISKIGDDYYWASRENVAMVPVESGAFITYVAINGTGYVKLIKPAMKEVAALMGAAEERFDYVEHLTFGLKSVTYYGVVRP